jgi:glutathione S-transferase
MPIEFFFMPGGPFALRCLMALSFKKLSFLPRKLDAAKQENRTPEFLALSPSGSLPVLKDGSTVVLESQAIMFYLDRAYPKMPLYGKTPEQAGRIMQELCEQQAYAEPVLQPFIASLFFGRPTSTESLSQASDKLDALLGELERRLGSNGWLAGKAASAADISLYPLVRSVIDGHETEKAAARGLKPRSLVSFPGLNAWMDRLKPYASAEH